MNKLDEIRERWSKATPGPWLKRLDAIADSKDKTYVINAHGYGCGIFEESDHDAIVSAPTDVAYLLARVDKLEQTLRELRYCADPETRIKIAEALQVR